MMAKNGFEADAENDPRFTKDFEVVSLHERFDCNRPSLRAETQRICCSLPRRSYPVKRGASIFVCEIRDTPY